MRISDWSSDVCSSDLLSVLIDALRSGAMGTLDVAIACASAGIIIGMLMLTGLGLRISGLLVDLSGGSLPLLLVLTMVASLILGMGLPTLGAYIVLAVLVAPRSEDHTSELQSLMRISYAVFCLKK